MLVKKSTEHHVSAVRSSVTSVTVSQIGSERQTQGDLRESKEKDFCVQVEMLPRPVMVDAGVQTLIESCQLHIFGLEKPFLHLEL